MPLFTVIMPVYNTGKWLRPSVESVLALHGDDYDVILVDDGSTDGSTAACDEIASKDSRVRVIHKPNGGLASARNAGIDAADGEYILMFDSDDFVEADTLDVLRPVIRKHQPDMIHFDLMKTYPDHEDPWPTKVPEGMVTGEKLRTELLRRVLTTPEDYLLSACIQAYRRVRLNQFHLRFVSEREVLSEDFLFNLQAMMRLDTLYVLPRCLYHYVTREGSLSVNSNKPRLFERYTCLYQHLLEAARECSLEESSLALIRTYYVHTLFYCTYCSYEYRALEGHSLEDGIRHVREALKSPVLHDAAIKADISGLPKREKLNVRFVRMRCEPGIRFAFRQRKTGR